MLLLLYNSPARRGRHFEQTYFDLSPRQFPQRLEEEQQLQPQVNYDQIGASIEAALAKLQAERKSEPVAPLDLRAESFEELTLLNLPPEITDEEILLVWFMFFARNGTM
jgi:hypothetical protein